MPAEILNPAPLKREKPNIDKILTTASESLRLTGEMLELG